MSIVAISFTVFVLIFLGIGIYSATRKQDTDEDFLIASRSIGPWMMALSAVATNNSGFMFVGLIGSTYIEGVSGIILIGGWVIGDYVAWLVGIPKKLRARSEKMGVATIPSFLGWGIPGGRMVVVIAGFIVLAFLGTYAAAQLTAGSKALHALFGWDTTIGAVIGAMIVVIYCFSGGIRASIWTDVAQSIVMFFAMIMLFLVGLNEVGGAAALWAQLEAIDPRLINFTPSSAPYGVVMFAIGWLFAGFGVVGQPHIMVRAMTLDSPQNMPIARRVYVTWNIVFAIGAIGVGLVSRVLLTETAGFDPELAMPTLSIQLLPEVLVGMVLAGLFAATLSTADSQVLSCSAAITQDIAPRPNSSHNYTRFGTVAVTAIMLAIALSGASVFGLVTLAWSVLASTLGPLLIAQSLGHPPRAGTAVAMMLGSFGVVLIWKYGFGFDAGLYHALPGMLTGLVIYYIGNALVGKPAAHDLS